MSRFLLILCLHHFCLCLLNYWTFSRSESVAVSSTSHPGSGLQSAMEPNVLWILFHSLLKVFGLQPLEELPSPGYHLFPLLFSFCQWRLRWRDQGLHPGLVAGEVALPIQQGHPRPGLCLPLGWGFGNRLLIVRTSCPNFFFLYWMDFCSLIRSKSWSIVLWFTGIASIDSFLTWSPINVFSAVVSCRPFPALTRWISTWGG